MKTKLGVPYLERLDKGKWTVLGSIWSSTDYPIIAEVFYRIRMKTEDDEYTHTFKFDENGTFRGGQHENPSQ